jgi:hypothetical protein
VLVRAGVALAVGAGDAPGVVSGKE